MICVLLCTYNGERYVEEQIRSILEQTVQDVHIVVSDDGSKDGTLAIVERLQKENPGRLTLLRQNPPTGSAEKHFLTLITKKCYDLAGRADYIMLSDQDDVWHSDKIEKTLKCMQAEEQRLSAAGKSGLPLLVHCDSVIVDRDLRKIQDSFVRYQKMTPERKHLNQLLVQNNVVGGALMMNRALAEKITRIPEHCVMHDQWIALVASALGEIHFVSESLYDYRQHGDNVLGAARGSRIREILGRFGLFRTDGRSKEEMDAHSRKVYREMFLQGQSFLTMYEDELTEKQKRALRAFTSMPEKNRCGKIATILRYGFTYNMLHRTIGEMLFI